MDGDVFPSQPESEDIRWFRWDLEHAKTKDKLKELIGKYRSLIEKWKTYYREHNVWRAEKAIRMVESAFDQADVKTIRSALYECTNILCDCTVNHWDDGRWTERLYDKLEKILELGAEEYERLENERREKAMKWMYEHFNKEGKE